MYLEHPIVKDFLIFVRELGFIWADEWTSAIHFVKFLQKQEGGTISLNEFDCWPKRFVQFIKKTNGG